MITIAKEYFFVNSSIDNLQISKNIERLRENLYDICIMVRPTIFISFFLIYKLSYHVLKYLINKMYVCGHTFRHNMLFYVLHYHIGYIIVLVCSDIFQ